MVLAAGTHIEVLRELGLGEDLLAALALDPEPLGYPDPGVLPSRKRIFLEPGHAPLPPESAYGSRPPEVCQGPSRDARGSRRGPDALCWQAESRRVSPREVPAEPLAIVRPAGNQVEQESPPRISRRFKTIGRLNRGS